MEESTNQLKIEKFETGAIREHKDAKSRPDLISPYFLERLGFVLAHGARLYGERNWEKGIPDVSCEASLERHRLGYIMSKLSGVTETIGKPEDDHLGQMAFNLMALIHNEEVRKIQERMKNGN